MASPTNHRQAWITLLTRSSYLPGVIILAHSLLKHKSQYPLIILFTSSLPSSVVSTLQEEAPLNNTILQQINPLVPVKQRSRLIAARFEDTWTKLRVFELYNQGYQRLIFLDADMLVLRSMDNLFDIDLPGKDWIAASHACVCNLDKDKWAPHDWRKENCAFTEQTYPQCLEKPTKVPKEGETGTKRTHTLLNSGLFIFEPTLEVWNKMLYFLNTSPLIVEFMFPDQDFLTEFFRGRWISIGWQYNALKTMKYWHSGMWRDEEVRNLHYIVDKPWSKRVGVDGTAGYLGRDGVTHTWWWEVYNSWEKERGEDGAKSILAVVKQEVAKALVEDEAPESLHGNWKAGEDA